MYGTIARFRVKPGLETQLERLAHEQTDDVSIPGLVVEYVYRMDGDTNDYFMVVAFESKEAYLANAQSPEQDVRYRRLRALLQDDPQWHDGSVVFAISAIPAVHS